MQFLSVSTPELITIGTTIIRIGIGILFIGHGYLKLIRGLPEWKWTGQQMSNLGITFAPVFWGICAMLAELLGGISLTLGFLTRLSMPLMSFVMIVAVIHHLKKGDSYGYVSFPLSQLIIFIGLFFIGSGPFSLDHYFFG